MTELEIWEKYCLSNNVDINTEYEAWQFGDDPDKLADLVVKGIKTATASAYACYEAEEEPLPKPGEHSIILDSNDNPVCIIKTTKVYLEKFKDVSPFHAYKEGEGDRSLEYWREVHKEFFTEELKEVDLEFSEDMIVVCEEFEVVYKG